MRELREKEYRHGLVTAQIEVDIPLQLRALRKERGLTQPQLAELTGMRQPRLSLMERPGGAHFTLETLRRLAEAFDVALIVRFAPFSELLGWSERFSPDDFSVPNFREEFEQGNLCVAGVGQEPPGAIPIDAFRGKGNSAPHVDYFKSSAISGLAGHQVTEGSNEKMAPARELRRALYENRDRVNSQGSLVR